MLNCPVRHIIRRLIKQNLHTLLLNLSLTVASEAPSPSSMFWNPHFMHSLNCRSLSGQLSACSKWSWHLITQTARRSENPSAELVRWKLFVVCLANIKPLPDNLLFLFHFLYLLISSQGWHRLSSSAHVKEMKTQWRSFTVNKDMGVLGRTIMGLNDLVLHVVKPLQWLRLLYTSLVTYWAMWEFSVFLL